MAKAEQILETLAAGIDEITTSEEWQRVLDVQARFHRYSFGNTILIAMQRSDASQVAGYKAWQSLGRQVRKGEKAIRILAPRIVKDADSGEKTVVGFFGVSVFDISQTDGEELPSVVTLLTGDDVSGAYDVLKGYAESLGYDVAFEDIDGDLNGYCTYLKRQIRVNARREGVQKVKTLAHEIAHALLHEKNNNRALAELEAESTAYVVCQALGIDSSDYSFGYVAHWTGGDREVARKAIKSSGAAIQRAAKSILDGIGKVEALDEDEALAA